jgi:hypothetical protein
VPALRGEFLKAVATIEAELAAAIAARAGADADHDLFPRVLAAATTGAARVATRYWLRPDTTAPFATVLRDALAVVAPMATAFDRRNV